jgi:hypothetical protein
MDHVRSRQTVFLMTFYKMSVWQAEALSRREASDLIKAKVEEWQAMPRSKRVKGPQTPLEVLGNFMDGLVLPEPPSGDPAPDEEQVPAPPRAMGADPLAEIWNPLKNWRNWRSNPRF